MSSFAIVPDVAAPEHIPDKQGKPCIALISLKAGSIRVDDFITKAGPNRPRIEQNMVLLLVPDTVKAKTGATQGELQMGEAESPAANQYNKLCDLARTVLAMRELKKSPQNYGINPQKLEGADFKKRHEERENALVSTVTESYRNLWYPSANGHIVCKEIRTAGGESGTPVIEQIRKALYDDGELLTSEHATLATLTNLRKLFFHQHDVVEVGRMRDNFQQLRTWPILALPDVFDPLIRAGVVKGVWCLFRMGDAETTLPDEFYSRDTGELPFDLDIRKGYSLVTPEGAKKRGWGKPAGSDPRRVQEFVRDITRELAEASVLQVCEKTGEKHGEMPEKDILDALANLLQESRIYAYKADVAQDETAGKPDLIHGMGAALYVPDHQDRIITPAKAAEKGWVEEKDNTIRLSGKDGAQKLMPMLRRMGSVFQKGGKSRIDMLDITDMALPAGGTLRIVLENAPPEAVKDLGEMFEVLDSAVQPGDRTECHLVINHPEKDCAFVDALKKNSK